MNVVQVIYGLSIGGSEVLAKNIALALKKDGHNPAICAVEHGGVLEDQLKSGGIPYKVLGRKPGEYLRTMKKAYDFFRSVNADVVHTHHLHELFYSAIPARLAGARLIHTEHEYFSLIPFKKRILLKFFGAFCSKITGVEDKVTEFIHHKAVIDRKKLVTVGNGVDMHTYHTEPKLHRHDLGIPDDVFTIGIVARLEKVKDHSTLFRAVKEFAHHHPVHLLVVGDGRIVHY